MDIFKTRSEHKKLQRQKKLDYAKELYPKFLEEFKQALDSYKKAETNYIIVDLGKLRCYCMLDDITIYELIRLILNEYKDFKFAYISHKLGNTSYLLDGSRHYRFVYFKVKFSVYLKSLLF